MPQTPAPARTPGRATARRRPRRAPVARPQAPSRRRRAPSPSSAAQPAPRDRRAARPPPARAPAEPAAPPAFPRRRHRRGPQARRTKACLALCRLRAKHPERTSFGRGNRLEPNGRLADPCLTFDHERRRIQRHPIEKAPHRTELRLATDYRSPSTHSSFGVRRLYDGAGAPFDSVDELCGTAVLVPPPLS